MADFTTDSIFESLKSLLTVVDNEERRKQIEAYIEAARSPLERAVFDLLSQFTDSINQQVGSHYKVTLSYRPGVLDAHVEPVEAATGEETVWSFSEGGNMEKITIRVPAELKDLATEAAAKASISANSWFLRVLARAVRHAESHDSEEHRHHRRHGRHGPGQRLSGWVGPE